MQFVHTGSKVLFTEWSLLPVAAHVTLPAQANLFTHSEPCMHKKLNSTFFFSGER